MSWVGVLVVGAVALLLFWQWLMLRLARRAEGQALPAGLNGAAEPGRSLYYFHSRHCGPCKGMTPIVERLAQTHAAVHVLDVEVEPKAAAEFGVRATPTIVLARDGVVERVYLGPRSEASLSRWLNG